MSFFFFNKEQVWAFIEKVGRVNETVVGSTSVDQL